MIHHVVLLRLKPGVSRDEPRVRAAIAVLVGLNGIVDGVVDWHHGWNFTERPIAYDFALVSSFRTRAAFDAYGPHPEHQKAIVALREVMDWVLADFEGAPA